MIGELVVAVVSNGGEQAGDLAAQTGVGLGTAIAVVCSWQRNRSILWAILAGFLSWLYVIYFAITRRPEEDG